MKDRELLPLASRTQFEAVLQYLQAAVQDRTVLHEVERGLLAQLLALGRTLLAQFLAAQGPGDQGPALSVGDGQILLRGEPQTRPYRSIFGELEIRRYVYGHGASAVAPLDGELNLPAWKYSYLLQEWGLGLSTQEAFAESGQWLGRILGQDLAVHSLERLSEKVAPAVAPFRAVQPPPPASEEAELVVVTTDGKGVPMKRPPQSRSKKGHRRQKGEKANKKKMACVGAVYTIDPFPRTVDQILDEVQRKACAAHRPAPQHKQVWAELVDDKEAFFQFLAQQVAPRRGTPAKPLLFLSDGERRLWTLQAQYLPEAVGILDLWHALEYLWKGAQVFHPEGSPQAEAWVEHRLRLLLDGKVGYVIGGLRQMSTKQGLTGTKKKTLETICTYFHNNRAHMAYDQYLAAGYPIGSGVAEGACRHLVKDRLERTGMRWTEAGAQAILDLRSVYLNGEWDAFWPHYTQAERARLYGQLSFDSNPTYSAVA